MTTAERTFAPVPALPAVPRWQRIASRAIELLAPACANVPLAFGAPISYRRQVLVLRSTSAMKAGTSSS